MDFIYTEEQRMLADSLRRLVDQEWTHARRRARQAAASWMRMPGPHWPNWAFWV